MKIERKTDKKLIRFMESSKLHAVLLAIFTMLFLIFFAFFDEYDKITEHQAIIGFVLIIFLFMIVINIFDSIERTTIILEIRELKKCLRK